MKVNCPTCKKEVEWSKESLHRPFCSKRCQLIDLGEWANEEKCIKGEAVTAENLPQNKTIYFD
ncbi:MAG: DNA gyrase inhibitor YacG [Psychromonas sp.]